MVDHIDPQNVFTAIKFFSKPVEQFMCDNGLLQTAEFILLTRNWFKACDKHGIAAEERVEYLYNMHWFLTKNIDFDTFPSKVHGMYIRGMPIQTYEAILQNISTRIFLYRIAIGVVYKSCSVSTLANESFFSDVN